MAGGLAIGGIAVAILRAIGDEMPTAVRLGFGGFFGLVLLVILGLNIGAAFETEKRLRTGIVTDKRVETYRRQNRSASYFFSIDGKELSAELWVYQQVKVGQRVTLHSTARLDSAFRVEVLDDPTTSEATLEAALDAPVAPFRPDSVPHDEAFTEEDHAVVRAHLLVSGVRRAAGGLLLGGVIWLFVVLAWVFARASLHSPDLDRTILVRVAPLAVLAVFALLNYRTVALLRDELGGLRHVATEGVLDVVHSDTVLLSPTAIVTGTGLRGDYAWVQTKRRWMPVPKPIAATLRRGVEVEVATAPRSGVVLAVAGAPAPRPRLGALDVVLLLVFVAVAWCFFATALESSGPATA